MNKPKKTPYVKVHLPDGVMEALDAHSRECGLAKSLIARRILANHFEVSAHMPLRTRPRIELTDEVWRAAEKLRNSGSRKMGATAIAKRLGVNPMPLRRLWWRSVSGLNNQKKDRRAKIAKLDSTLTPPSYATLGARE